MYRKWYLLAMYRKCIYIIHLYIYTYINKNQLVDLIPFN